ncbi:MAG: amidase domain-containing protein, partial [Candidatus Delongbacteria bacterium]|nr:amidase domain-containing protein [Candidatus Delongbacteria bacterium]
CNYIKVVALRLLFKYDEVLAIEISEKIIKNYVPNNSKKMGKYENFPEEVRKVLLENQRKNDKDKTPRGTKATGSIYDNIWTPDSSATYCEEFWGPDSSKYNNADYKHWAFINKDCANFGSQCLIYGGIDLSNATVNAYLHPCGETTIVNCDALNNFLIDDRTDSMTQSNINSSTSVPNWFRKGDIAIVGDADDILKHTIICNSDLSSVYLFGSHTANRIDSVLSWWLGGSYADRVTFYHVIGSTVLKNPDKDSLSVQLGDSLNLEAIVTNNTDPVSLNPITNFKYILKKKPENTLETLYETSNSPSALDSTYVFSFNTASQDTGRYILYAKTTYTEGITQDSCILKIKPIPEIIYPTPEDIVLIKPPGKAIATDTLEIKIRVPEVSGSYPNIKLKIDGVYVEQNDIVLEDSIYVYPWILNTVSSDPMGKRIKVEPELFDDPNCSSTSNILTVEAVFLETFLGMTDLISDGWTQEGTGSTPGWIMGPDPFDFPNKCARSYSIANSKAFYLMLRTPSFTVPDSSICKTKLEYKLYFKYSMIPFSYIYFDVCNESGTPLTSTQMLGPAYGLWTNMNYDLSRFSGQTIRLRWNHNYTNGLENCYFTQYAIENIAVYAIPDMDSPSIDFIYGNQAYVDEDMNINLEFNDVSDIESVTADYEIEGDSDTITLTTSKDTYFYSGTIPARDHECYGTIVFKIKDTVGNETVSESYSISWVQPGSVVITAPQNVEIASQTDSTLALTWDMVAGASGYKVYSSLDPYGVFSGDSTGTFTESRKWEKLFDGNKYFYYIIATDEAKKELMEIVTPREVGK